MDKNQFLNSLKDSAGNIERVEELEKELENENNNETAEQKKERLFQRGLVAFFAELTLRNRDRELENQLKLNNKTGAILIVGLAKCGKTTILKTIKENNGGHLIINNLNKELNVYNSKLITFNLLNEKLNNFSGAGIDAVFFLIDAYNTSDSFNTRNKLRITILKSIQLNHANKELKVNNVKIVTFNLLDEKPDSFSSAGIDAVFFLIDIYNTSDSFNTRSFQYLIEGDEVNIHLLRNARDYSVRLLNLLGLSF
ncbi:unnamed protein product [Adineta steineri]|uniref:Uncharacterized protein n=1 Tax=Adineta steineri TaxID=433720 RepID=A0A815F863_9BILA|nr:unnamed protein product [Adineta steineri]